MRANDEQTLSHLTDGKYTKYFIYSDQISFRKNIIIMNFDTE